MSARAEGAWCEAGGGRSLSHRHGGGGGHCIWRCGRDGCRAGLRGDACGVPRWLCRSRLYGPLCRLSGRAGGASCGALAGVGGARSPACPRGRSRISPRCTARRSAPIFVIGYGFARSRNGAASMHAVTCLPTVTGKWQHEGAGALWSYRSIYNWDKTLIEGLDAIDPTTRILDMSRLASVLTGDREALCDGPPVHAMLIQNSNPRDRGARHQSCAPRLLARRPVRRGARAVHDGDRTARRISCCRQRCSWSTTICIRPAGTATSRSARS